MNNPQDRIIKQMINNIVERNKPEFEKSSTPVASGTTTAAAAVASAPEENQLLARKLEYGFNTMRQENAEMRKVLDELKGMLSMMRNDVDSLRMAVQQGMRSSAPAQERHVPQAAPAASMGAPQYRKTEADEAYEQKHGGSSHEEEKPQQARGFTKKDEGAQIDISKVFYYGKK